MNPDNAVPLLWAHQLKREHKHLLQRLLTLESTVPRNNITPRNSSADADGNAVEGKDASIACVRVVEALQERIIALETINHAKDAHQASMQAELIAIRESLTTVQAECQHALNTLTENLSALQHSLDDMSSSFLQHQHKLSSLDTEVSTDALAIKQAHEKISTLQSAAETLTDRVWALENGISNLQSERRDDGEKFSYVAARLKALDVAEQWTTEKLDRVFKVAEVLVARDEEVRGRLGDLEARLAAGASDAGDTDDDGLAGTSTEARSTHVHVQHPHNASLSSYGINRPEKLRSEPGPRPTQTKKNDTQRPQLQQAQAEANVKAKMASIIPVTPQSKLPALPQAPGSPNAATAKASAQKRKQKPEAKSKSTSNSNSGPSLPSAREGCQTRSQTRAAALKALEDKITR